MGYTMYKCMGTEYAVDWGVLERLTMSSHRAYYQNVCSDVKEASESKWYNPLSWSLPTIKSVEVDWPKVREAARSATDRDIREYQRSATRDMRGVALDIQYRIEQGAANRRSFADYLKDTSRSNMAAIDAAVDDYTGLADYARFVRDSSVDVIMIGSTVATGGAATALLGAGSTLKGGFKYQDTGSVGAAILYGGGSLALGAFKVGGKKVTASGEYILIAAQGFLEGSTSFVAGDSFGKAVANGALKIASAGEGQAVFGSHWLEHFFDRRWSLPFNIWSITSRNGALYTSVDVASQFIDGAAKKGLEKGVKYGIKAVARESTPPPRTSSAGVADEANIEQQFLLAFSIVNMAKGIGQGW